MIFMLATIPRWPWPSSEALAALSVYVLTTLLVQPYAQRRRSTLELDDAVLAGPVSLSDQTSFVYWLGCGCRGPIAGKGRERGRNR